MNLIYTWWRSEETGGHLDGVNQLLFVCELHLQAIEMGYVLDRLKYEVIKEGSFSFGGWYGFFWEGRMVVEDTTNNLRWVEGSGMRISSKWQLIVFVECMRLRRGCVDGASEWCRVVIMNWLFYYSIVSHYQELLVFTTVLQHSIFILTLSLNWSNKTMGTKIRLTNTMNILLLFANTISFTSSALSP